MIATKTTATSTTSTPTTTTTGKLLTVYVICCKREKKNDLIIIVNFIEIIFEKLIGKDGNQIIGKWRENKDGKTDTIYTCGKSDIKKNEYNCVNDQNVSLKLEWKDNGYTYQIGASDVKGVINDKVISWSMSSKKWVWEKIGWSHVDALSCRETPFPE